MLPRLNQTATFYSSIRTSDFGVKIPNDNGFSKKCRYAVITKTYRDSKGDDITYNAEIHLNYDGNIKKGCFFKLDNDLTYEIIETTHTPNLAGQYFKTFCILKESYIEI